MARKSHHRKPARRTFVEQINLANSKIDESECVIRNVKVLGFESRNGRRYSKEACRKALAKYENCPVYLNHSNRETRGIEEKVGWISAPRLAEDGIYGDLNLLKSDPNTSKIVEMAKRNPSQCGLSHNVEGDGFTSADGVYEVHEIVEVNSVDLVDKPATTNGLFESVTMNVAQMFERLAGQLPARKAKVLRRWLKEDGEMPAGTDAPPEAANADPNEALTAGFQEVATSLLKSILSGDMEPKAGLKKLGTLIKTHFNLTADDEPAEEEEDPKADDEKKEGEDEPDDEKKEGEDEPKDKDDMEEEEDDDEKKDKKESLSKRLARLEAANHVLTLCESLNVRLTDVQREAAAGLDRSKRKQFIESLKRKQDRTGPVIDARSSGPVALREGTVKLANSYDEFLAVIRG